MNHFRLAFRRLATQRAFSAAAVACLALGIGANGAVFGALNGLLRRPLPFTDAGRIVWLFARPAAAPPSLREKLTGDEATALAERMTSFAAIAVIGDRSLFVERQPRHVQWHGLWVTPGVFEVLDVTPAAGRALDLRDAGTAGPPALMLSHERWVRDFGRDPTIVGRVLPFADNKRFTVVGILPAGLEFPIGRPPHSGNGSGFVPGGQDFWILGQENAREYPGGTALARVRAGTSVRAAAAEAEAVATELNRRRPGGEPPRTFALVSLRDQLLGTLAPALPLAQAFAVLVLIIAAANVANLMLVRAVGLERDAAIRLALGASRRSTVMPLLAEGLLLSGAGSMAGIALAWASLRWIRTARAPHAALAERVDSGGDLLLVAGVLSLVTTLVSVVAPIGAGRLSIAALLGRTDARQGTHASVRWRAGLVITQVALAIVLVTGASLLYRSLSRLTSVDLGYEKAHTLTADLMLYVPIREVQTFYTDVMPRIRRMPGVEAVGLIQSTPLTGKWTFTDTITREADNATRSVQAAGNFVAYDYFSAMQIPLVAGRSFTEPELRARRPPVILNEVAAARLFGGENPLGEFVRLGGGTREVVGVVKGTRDVTLEQTAGPQYYEPGLFGDSQLVVRVAGDPSRVVPTLQAELLAADPRVIIRRVQPLNAIIEEQVFERRMINRLLGAFAAAAFLLAIAGLYGVTYAGTIQRRHEFGVRAALGARPADLLRLVLRQALGLASRGVVVGLAMSLAAGRVLRSLLFETSSTEWTSLAGASLLLLVVAAAASLAPAIRAARVDPVTTLRAG